MSTFYLCEHKEKCCGICVRAAKTENLKLEVDRDKLAGEVQLTKEDRDRWADSAVRLEKALEKMKARCFELECHAERAEKQAEELTEALTRIKSHWSGDCGCYGYATEALAKHAAQRQGDGKDKP